MTSQIIKNNFTDASFTINTPKTIEIAIDMRFPMNSYHSFILSFKIKLRTMFMITAIINIKEKQVSIRSGKANSANSSPILL